MKIIFFRHSLLSRGGDKMIVAHASHLAASGHDVTIKASHVDTVFNLHPCVRIHPLKSTSKLGTLLTAALESQDADIVIADIIVLACLLALRNGRKCLYYAQDYDESYYRNPFAKLFIRLLYWVGFRILQLKGIAVAQHLAETFHRRFRADATVVENGIDPAVFFPDPDPELITGKEQRQAVLLLSRSDARKGFDLAKQVVNDFASEIGSSCEIWTVGEAAGGFLGDMVHRDLGYVDEQRLRKVMSSADLFFYPTRHEGLPLMPLEAMACGCPVVTTTAVPYAVHKDNALVADVGDCPALSRNLLELLRDSHLREQLIKGGCRTATRVSMSKTVRLFETAVMRLGTL